MKFLFAVLATLGISFAVRFARKFQIEHLKNKKTLWMILFIVSDIFSAYSWIELGVGLHLVIFSIAVPVIGFFVPIHEQEKGVYETYKGD